MPWGLEIFYRRDPAGFVDVHSLDGVSTGQLAMVVQPTFLYELLWNLLVFAILIFLDRRYTIGHGRLFAAYVALYCVGRFCVELLRDDTATHIAGIRINSFTSMFVFIGAVVYLILAPKGREDPATLSGSAAELLEPDSIDDVDDAAPETTPAAETTSPVGPDDEDAQKADTAVVDDPDVDAEAAAVDPDAEAVAAEADAAEVDAPEVEVAATAEPDDAPEDEDEATAESAEDDPDPSADDGDEETDAAPDDAEADSDADPADSSPPKPDHD
jgi:Prolipoprotein diacylglyceryl transferase